MAIEIGMSGNQQLWKAISGAWRDSLRTGRVEGVGEVWFPAWCRLPAPDPPARI